MIEDEVVCVLVKDPNAIPLWLVRTLIRQTNMEPARAMATAMEVQATGRSTLLVDGLSALEIAERLSRRCVRVALVQKSVDPHE